MGDVRNWEDTTTMPMPFAMARAGLECLWAWTQVGQQLWMLAGVFTAVPILLMRLISNANSYSTSRSAFQLPLLDFALSVARIAFALLFSVGGFQLALQAFAELRGKAGVQWMGIAEKSPTTAMAMLYQFLQPVITPEFPKAAWMPSATDGMLVSAAQLLLNICLAQQIHLGSPYFAYGSLVSVLFVALCGSMDLVACFTILVLSAGEILRQRWVEEDRFFEKIERERLKAWNTRPFASSMGRMS